jgi:enoyl-CoA hydratase/carnithine racemase
MSLRDPAPSRPRLEPVDGLRISTDGGVRTIWFSRPDRRNAMTLVMFRAYYDALLVADRDPAVRAIVVTGEGDWFCSGADPDGLTALAEADVPGGNVHRKALLEDCGYPPHTPMQLGTPLIAAINGGAAGLGLVHALYADVRFMATEAKVSTAFSRLGLVAEYGSAWLLPRLIGVPAALDLLLSARKINADEAMRLGLVQYALPRAEVLDAATAYATELATRCAPMAMAAIRRQVWAGLDSTAEQSAWESVRLMGEALARPDLLEAITAGLQGRPPSFLPWPPPAKGVSE